MKIEIAAMNRMAERGSSLLRLIQNSHTPLLDLLLRESIQNSLDARSNGNTPIKYDISVSNFDTKKVAPHFQGIESSLISRFSEHPQKSIVIRDFETTGLTGPIHHDFIENEEYGNLLKLVYEISMPQEKKEAGGSWGLGKTVYFRVGIGLVIYYTRVEEAGEFKSRLVACLVEDESSNKTLIPNKDGKPKRGIAWWGERHTENSTKPITNESEINELLSCFNVKPYEENQTGTTVIIPFINEKNLINDQFSNHDKPWWHKNIEHYLEIGIQRWYAPRIDNPFYPYGGALKPSVSGRVITKENMEPIFSLIRTLYISTQSENDIGNYSLISKDEISIKPIKINRDLTNNVVGKLAFIKVSKDTLKMNIPHNKKSPYIYLDLNNDLDINPPILTYLRKPGMIIDYETEGKWTNGIEATNSNEFLLAIFVPDSNNFLAKSESPLSLDEYLRKGEKADHSSWNDIVLDNRKQTIVERIQKKVVYSIKEELGGEGENTIGNRSGALSKSLAKTLLPPIGFGNSPSVPAIEGHDKPRPLSNSYNNNFTICSNEVSKDGKLTLNFKVNSKTEMKTLDLELFVDAEGGKKISGDDWEKEDVIGTEFPVQIEGISVDLENSILEYKVEYKCTKEYGICNSAIINLESVDNNFSGQILITSNDPMVQASIKHDFKRLGETS